MKKSLLVKAFICVLASSMLVAGVAVRWWDAERRCHSFCRNRSSSRQHRRILQPHDYCG